MIDFAALGYLDGIEGKNCLLPENRDYYRNWRLGFNEFYNR